MTEVAPSALLAGQICDGIATPVVGMLSDKFNTRIGQRKPWYIAGLILVCICYVPLWSGYSSDSVGAMYAFYTIFAGIFNFGWAALQISHMSLVPSLTCSRKRRVTLYLFRTNSIIWETYLHLSAISSYWVWGSSFLQLCTTKNSSTR